MPPPKTESNDPDWTAGTKIGKLPDGRYIVAHHVRDRKSPSGVEALIKNTATADGKDVKISLPQDPGQAGKSQVQQPDEDAGGLQRQGDAGIR